LDILAARKARARIAGDPHHFNLQPLTQALCETLFKQQRLRIELVGILFRL
jgi:hypothetical protein